MTKNLVFSLILGISLVILLGISSTAAQEQSIPNSIKNNVKMDNSSNVKGQMLPKYLASAGLNFSGASGSPKGGVNGNGTHSIQQSIAAPISPPIPSWIKNNAKYWSAGQIPDSDFTKGIQYLINQGIMKIPQTKPSTSQSNGIPSWVKNNAKYWSEGKITDSEFVKGIQYLAETGIIVTNIQADQAQCDPTLWDHVYHPQRLNILELCAQVSGTIKEITPQPNGDYQIRLSLDPNYKFMVNQANVDQQHGSMVLETICQNPSQLQDAVQSCQGWTGTINIPPVGTHVVTTGSYVLDLEHDRLAEIHPISSIGVILADGTIWYNKTIPIQNTVPIQNPGAKPDTTSIPLRIDLAEHDYIKRGTIQSMIVEVSDGANPVSGASVIVHVVDALGYTAKDFTGVTDSKGEFSPSWTISSNSKPGSFQVGIDATKDGYTPAHRSFSFDVV